MCGYTITALLARLFSGYIVDCFPRKKVLVLCYALFALFFAGYLIAPTVLLFAIVRTLHGIPFGATTVSNSTVMIDSLPSSRRTEGIGYYGISNNIAMAIGPTCGITLYHATNNFTLLFSLSLAIALLGLIIDSTVKCRYRTPVKGKMPVSLDRFFLINAIPESITIVCMAFPFGIISTYLAIYSRDILNNSSATGIWFAVLSLGLIMSRIVGAQSLKKGRIVQNASFGVSVSLIGYFLFVALPNEIGYYASAVCVGLGNGHLWPAMQNMFINLTDNSRRGTANSTLLVAWDAGIGAGVILGGVISENNAYSAAFWTGVAVNAIGVFYYWMISKKHYLMNKIQATTELTEVALNHK